MKEQFEHLLDVQDKEYVQEMGFYPLCAAMCDALNIPQFINEATGPRDPRAALDYGTVVKAFIINMLDQRTPLYHFSQAFANVDCEVLFGEGIYADLFSVKRLEDTLDAVAELDHRSLASSISLRNLSLYGLPINFAHIDTTNKSLFGNYEKEEDDDDDFNITYGKAKDKRDDLKLVTIGNSAQQDGLPLFGEALSGNSSDAVWFREAMEEMNQFCSGDLNTNPILVFDAAASNKETMDQACDQKMPSVIRLSRVFNAANDYVRKAWEEGGWEEVGTVADYENKKSAKYSTRSFDVTLGENVWRLIVVHSSQLQAKKVKSSQEKLEKAKEKLNKDARKLEKKEYETAEKAYEKAEKFLDNRSSMEKLIDCEIGVNIKTIERYSRPGRPTPDTEIITITTYQPQITVGDVNEKKYNSWLEDKSCFVIVSNVPKKRCSDQELLEEYKKQWKIEDHFKFVKAPQVLKPICLEKPKRIKALIFILWLAVMTASYLRYRLLQTLSYIEEKNERKKDNAEASVDPEIKSKTDNKQKSAHSTDKAAGLSNKNLNQEEDFSKKSPEEIYYDVVDNEVSAGIQLGGKLFKRPSLKTVARIINKARIKITWENGNIVRKFPRDTKGKILKLIVYMGFDPAIYIKPYNPGLDLWPYP